MKLSKIKKELSELRQIAFQLPNGELVPSHFHVTEVGKISKHFIDCGGAVRNEEVVNFQLWDSTDYDHRLHPKKLLEIIELSEKVLGIEDLEIEVEYQGESINKFGLDFDGTNFILTTKQTDCLAKENCGIPQTKPKIQLANLSEIEIAACVPGGGCC